MKKTLIKILFISLLFSTAIPSTMQVSLDWAAWGNGARKAVSFLTENRIKVELGVAVGTALAWKMFNEYRKRKLEEEKKTKKEVLNSDLLQAAENNNIAEVNRTLLDGADIDQQDWLGCTAVMLAAHNGNPEVVKLLLANRAEINKQNNAGCTALIEAAKNGRLEVVELLLATNKVYINQQDKLGMTALMRATANRHLEIVELLLATEKSDINQQNRWSGETALMRATANGYSEIVKLLLATEKADINQQNKRDETALIIAANCGHPKIVKLLLANGADVNQKHGETALAIAAEREKHSIDLIGKQKFRDIIGQLLAADADQQIKCKITGISKQVDLKEYLQYMRETTPRILNKELSDEELPYKEKLKGLDKKNIPELIAEFAYSIL